LAKKRPRISRPQKEAEKRLTSDERLRTEDGQAKERLIEQWPRKNLGEADDKFHSSLGLLFGVFLFSTCSFSVFAGVFFLNKSK
jgi:hypothetical protein